MTSHISKSDLVDGVEYEGHSASSGYSHAATWDALNNRFLVKEHIYGDLFDVPMNYPGDENEYFDTFFPILRKE